MNSVAVTTGTKTLDARAIRADFPIFEQLIHGKPLAFLDSAASSQKPRQMVEAMADFYSTSYANVHRGVYVLAERATAALENSREKVRALLNAPDVREIIFVRNATEAITVSATSVVGSIASASCAAPLDAVAYPSGTPDNNYGYVPGLDFGTPIDLYSAVQTYVGSTAGACTGCGNFLEVCFTTSNCGGGGGSGGNLQDWFAGKQCVALDTSVGQPLTGSPGNDIGPVISGLGDRGYVTSANNATCPQTLSSVVDTSTWRVINNSSICLIQIAILDYNQAFNSSGRSTFLIDGFATVFLQSFDGSAKTFSGVFVKSTAPGKVSGYRNSGTKATRLIR